MSSDKLRVIRFSNVASGPFMSIRPSGEPKRVHGRIEGGLKAGSLLSKPLIRRLSFGGFAFLNVGTQAVNAFLTRVMRSNCFIFEEVS